MALPSECINRGGGLGAFPDYNQAKYGNMIMSRPLDINGDGAHDWVASDWGYLGANGSSNNMGAIYISYQQ